MAFDWPFPRDLISGVYPGSSSYNGHSGIDWPGARVGNGSPVRSVGPGVVVGRTVNSANDPYNFSEPTWRGNSITIDHGTIDGHGITTLYAHMLDAPLVNIGDTVDVGTVIGYVGNSGASDGAHLHLEVIFDGVRLPTSSDPDNYPGLGYTRTLTWLDEHVGTGPTPTPGPRRRRRDAWLNRPPTHGYRTW